MPTLEHFLKYVNRQLDGCWLWIGTIKNSLGYGSFHYNKNSFSAHKMSWTLYNGEIPKGLVVRHQCDTPRCVNPKHLLLGTQKQNMQDMVKRGRHANQQKTHCKNGHPLAGDNLRMKTQRTKKVRRCIICIKATANRNYAKRMALAKIKELSEEA